MNTITIEMQKQVALHLKSDKTGLVTPSLQGKVAEMGIAPISVCLAMRDIAITMSLIAPEVHDEESGREFGETASINDTTTLLGLIEKVNEAIAAS